MHKLSTPHLSTVLEAADPRTALSDPHRAGSAETLTAEAWAWARVLAGKGLTNGDRVVLLLPNSLTLAAVLFGATRAGLIAVPLHPSTPAGQLDAVLRDCRPGLLVTDAAGARSAAVSRVPTVVVDPRHPTERDGNPPPDREPGTIASIMYTSGSTGDPRGVVCPHAQVVFAVEAIGARLGYRADDVVFDCLPMSFDYGLYQLFLALRAGSRLVLASGAGGPDLLVRASSAGTTVFPLVPSLARRLCLLGSRAGARVPPVRLFTNTGETLTAAACADLRRVFPGAGVIRMFGLTECKRVTIGVADDDLVAPDAVGTPLPGTSIEVVDAAGVRLATGEVGELVVRGPHVMAGYWGGDARRTFRSTPQGPALFTGDHGRIDEAGRFCFSHRADGVFKVGATRVSAGEIEAAANGIDAVRAACVIRRAGRADPAVFVASDLRRPEVMRELIARLGSHRTPTDVFVLGDLPLTGSGKVNRGELLKMLRDRDG
jgi:acyl-CoA synthetase (AMP-forming)/AMP-acid ligase II